MLIHYKAAWIWGVCLTLLRFPDALTVPPRSGTYSHSARDIKLEERGNFMAQVLQIHMLHLIFCVFICVCSPYPPTQVAVSLSWIFHFLFLNIHWDHLMWRRSLNLTKSCILFSQFCLFPPQHFHILKMIASLIMHIFYSFCLTRGSWLLKFIVQIEDTHKNNYLAITG